MAVTYVIPLGSPHVMITNEEYALPAVPVLLNAQGLGAGALETSNDKSTWTAVTLDTTENVELAAAWIRCTTAANACIVVAKALH